MRSKGGAWKGSVLSTSSGFEAETPLGGGALPDAVGLPTVAHPEAASVIATDITSGALVKPRREDGRS
jgi:hypothetical protein